jgi:hypothetical protein
MVMAKGTDVRQLVFWAIERCYGQLLSPCAATRLVRMLKTDADLEGNQIPDSVDDIIPLVLDKVMLMGGPIRFNETAAIDALRRLP